MSQKKSTQHISRQCLKGSDKPSAGSLRLMPRSRLRFVALSDEAAVHSTCSPRPDRPSCLYPGEESAGGAPSTRCYPRNAAASCFVSTRRKAPACWECAQTGDAALSISSLLHCG